MRFAGQKRIGEGVGAAWEGPRRVAAATAVLVLLVMVVEGGGRREGGGRVLMVKRQGERKERTNVLIRRRGIHRVLQVAETVRVAHRHAPLGRRARVQAIRVRARLDVHPSRQHTRSIIHAGPTLRASFITRNHHVPAQSGCRSRRSRSSRRSGRRRRWAACWGVVRRDGAR